MARRLAGVGLESTEPVRRAYREALFTTPDLARHVSGVILYDETIRQRASDGTPMPALLDRAGIIPGIKVDAGVTALPSFPGEVVTAGLDGLRERLADYAALGARFAKWRAVIRIGEDRPSEACLRANAHALARYAALAQEAGLTPIVEPEVLMDGSHSMERCASVTSAALRYVYEELARHRVELDGTLLKPNMVLPGEDAAESVDDSSVAERTLAVLRDTVPASVPGIVFLSGGQTEEEATARLAALNRSAPQPWQLSFSFGRALQAPALRAWAAGGGSVPATQAALFHQAALAGAARYGAHDPAGAVPARMAPAGSGTTSP